MRRRAIRARALAGATWTASAIGLPPANHDHRPMPRSSIHLYGPVRASMDAGSFSSVIVDPAASAIGPEDSLGPGSPALADVLERARCAFAEERYVSIWRSGVMVGVTCVNNPRGSGVLVSSLAPGSAAAAAGLLVGDTIIGVEGKPIDNHQARSRRMISALSRDDLGA